MSEHEPEAGPEQQASVRRLLADARHTEPLPADVAARLDAALGELTAERSAPTTSATVHDLAARRRRRVTRLLGAAAAVVVLGVGVGQLTDRTLDGDGTDSSTSDVGGAAAEDRGTLDREDSAAGPESAPGPLAPVNPAEVPPQGDVPTVGRGDLRASVLRLRDQAPLQSFAVTPLRGEDLTADELFVCGTATYGPGRLLPVRYSGAPAVLAFRPPTGDVQSVDLLQCGTATVLRSVVVPAP